MRRENRVNSIVFNTSTYIFGRFFVFDENKKKKTLTFIKRFVYVIHFEIAIEKQQNIMEKKNWRADKLKKKVRTYV